MSTQLGLIPLPAEDQALADQAEAFVRAKEMLEAAKESFEVLKIQLAAHFPEDPGEHIRVVGKHTIKVKRGEKWSWDSNKLEEMFASTPLPDYVNSRYSVHKDEFEKLTQEQQDEVAAALTKGVGSATVTVTVTP